MLPNARASTLAVLWLLSRCQAKPYVPSARAVDAALLSGLPTAYTAAPTPPVSAFSSYYPGFEPTQTTAQPQPVVSDPVSGQIYPLNLTDGRTLPLNDTVDPIVFPLPLVNNASADAAYGIAAISAIIEGDTTSSNCTKCLDSLVVAKQVALANPQDVETLAIELCIKYKFATVASCRNMYSRKDLAPILAQILVNADVAGYDGRLLCANKITSVATCPQPETSPLDLTDYFAKPKPSNASALVPKANGNRIKVLHASDMHIDPRYVIGSTSNCPSGMCCRSNSALDVNVTAVPAPRFGAFQCDSPYSLVLSALGAIPELTGTKGSGFGFTVYTGDLVSHDPDNELSREYVLYTEAEMFRLMKEYLGSGPLYAAIGNHDEFQQSQAWQHVIHTGDAARLASAKSFNYDHLAALWEHEGWISETVANVSRSHYGGYSTITPQGLKVITINTDFFYKSNWFNFINATNPDLSGTLRWLTDELQDAEDKAQRVWIVGHVLTGWDGTNPLTNPTNLFYQIIDRYSPHVVANILFGHTHEDLFTVFYANNASSIDRASALATAWIGPSLTPLTNLNAGFRMYEVDTGDFNIYEAHTWFSNVSSYASLDSTGPVFQYEYSTRATYGVNSTWPSDAPLNATFWHVATENMARDPSLVQRFNTLQGKSSDRTKTTLPCNTTACWEAKVCYMRSGSVAIARENCKTGYGSVQGG